MKKTKTAAFGQRFFFVRVLQFAAIVTYATPT
jgi:hypothetical protein